MKALTEIQNELKAPKNQYNSFGKYKYRSCEDILEAVKPLLKKHKCTLTITDEVREVGGLVFVDAVATITSYSENEMVKEFDKDGNEIKQVYSVQVSAQAGIDPNRKGMDIAQSFGSSSSYARKYALNGLFLIDDTKDADATNDHGKGAKNKPSTPKKKVVKFGTDEFTKVVDWIVEEKGTIERAKELYDIDEYELKKAVMVKKELT